MSNQIFSRYLKRFAAVLFIAVCLASPARAEVVTVDLARVKPGKLEEALYYYRENWQAFREQALDRGYISGFELLVDAREPGAETILLITRYADRHSYDAREENFAVVMPPGGPALLNDLQPKEFVSVDFLGDYEPD